MVAVLMGWLIAVVDRASRASYWTIRRGYKVRRWAAARRGGCVECGTLDVGRFAQHLDPSERLCDDCVPF